jgi:alpha-D-ribose 1-methylphosphonate 5-triphosphate synthase subunit PhnH
LLVELPSLTDGPDLDWRGPGIQDVQQVRLQGLPTEFWTQWYANHASFPQGVDLIFTCGEFATGLPRTTQVQSPKGI